MFYYLIFCLATYLTVLFSIYIPVEVTYRALSKKEISIPWGIATITIRQMAWGIMSIVLAPMLFYSLMRESNTDIKAKLVTDLLMDD